MKKLFLFLTPLLLLIVLFRFFNNAGYLNGETILSALTDFDYDFDKTVKFLGSVKNVWSEIDFFPINVTSLGTFFKAIGYFFKAIFDFLKSIGYSLGLVFTLIYDIAELILSIFEIIFRIFGFEYVL